MITVTDLADQKEGRVDGGDMVTFSCLHRQGKEKIAARCSLYGVGSDRGDKDAIRCWLFVQEWGVSLPRVKVHSVSAAISWSWLVRA